MHRGIAWLVFGTSATRSEIVCSLVFGPLGPLLLILQLLAVFGRKSGAARAQIMVLAFFAVPPLLMLPMVLGKSGDNDALTHLLVVTLLIGLNAMNLLTLWEMGKWRRRLDGPKER